MKATTHTEVYRPFEGELRRRTFRSWPLAWSGMRVGGRRKLPLLMLFAPPMFGGIAQSVIVHLLYQAEAGSLGTEAAAASAIAQAAGMDADVGNRVVSLVEDIRVFALLAVAWFGAGLIAEDKRLGAHLLYFSRPLSRLDYLLGKWLTAAAFGVVACLVPAFLICATASFSSPEWSFVVNEWDTVFLVLWYCTLWITALVGFTLAVSSLVERKAHALAGIFGGVFLLHSIGRVCAELLGDDRWTALSVFDTFNVLASWFFDKPGRFQYDHRLALGSAMVWCFGTLIVASRRVRRLEVVAVKGDEALALVAGGVVDGLSIGFQAIDQDWTRKHVESGLKVRDLREVKLVEVSLVTEGAYAGAKVTGLRTIQPQSYRQRLNNLKRNIMTNTKELHTRRRELVAEFESLIDEDGTAPEERVAAIETEIAAIDTKIERVAKRQAVLDAARDPKNRLEDGVAPPVHGHRDSFSNAFDGGHRHEDATRTRQRAEAAIERGIEDAASRGRCPRHVAVNGGRPAHCGPSDLDVGSGVSGGVPQVPPHPRQSTVRQRGT